MRAFIGIEFDRETKKEIFDYQQKIKRYAVRGRFKFIDNLHLTLKFLGETDGHRQIYIDNTLKSICAGKQPLNLKIEDSGIFKGKDTIRVLWLGLAGDIQKLKALQSEIDNKLSHAGFKKEKRKYTPHITIGQDIIFKYHFEKIKELTGQIEFKPVRVEKLHLFKSEQVKNKRIYTKISNYEL